MNIMQLAELLSLLDMGGKEVLPTKEIQLVAYEYATNAWEASGLNGSAPDKIEYAFFIESAGKHLCYFNIGSKDSFMIVVVQLKPAKALSHLIMDIGAEYHPVTYSNISTGYEGIPTEERIQREIPKLIEKGTPAAILESRDGSYIQTYQISENLYDLEYQLVTTQFHFKTPEPVSSSVVIDAFISYAFGKYEWARNIEWVHYPL